MFEFYLSVNRNNMTTMDRPDCSSFNVKQIKEELKKRGIDYAGLSINEKVFGPTHLTRSHVTIL